MPTAYLKKLAKLNHTTVNKLEKFWSQAKEIAKSEGNGKAWGLITTIFQNKLKKEGYKVKAFTSLSDTDELDDADLGVGIDPKEYHNQKSKMKSLKDRIIDAYENFISRNEKEAEKSWKRDVKYRSGGGDEDDLIRDYEKRWKEKFTHKNSLTLIEFYKIMMSNEDTRSYIYGNSKDYELEGLLIGANKYYEDDEDVNEKKRLRKPGGGSIVCSIDTCRKPENKEIYKKEVFQCLETAKSVKGFLKLMNKRYDHYDSLNSKAYDKIDDLIDHGKKVPKELYKKRELYENIGDACLEWDDEEWLYDMATKCGSIKVLKGIVEQLFKTNFNIKTALGIYNKLIAQTTKHHNTEKKNLDELPAVVTTMYNTFLDKMKVHTIYRAVKIDIEWVDDQLDKMERKQKDKASYLRKHNYRERMGLANVNLHAVGKSWCWNEESTKAVGGYGDTYILVGQNDYSNIDLTMSALCAAEWSNFRNKGSKIDGEQEIRILNEFDVTIVDVYTKKGKNKINLNRKETYYRNAASANGDNMKPYSYNGRIITASSKREAIQQIVADSNKPKIDMKIVNKWAKKNMNITDEGIGKDHWKNPKTGEVYYTWDAAVRLSKKIGGYHLPSAEEWNKLAEACGGVCSDSSAKPGRKEYDKCGVIKKLLKIELVGTYREDGYFSGGNYSGFWTSTDFDNETAYYKLFGVGNSMIAHRHSKTMGLSVRLVRD